MVNKPQTAKRLRLQAVMASRALAAHLPRQLEAIVGHGFAHGPMGGARVGFAMTPRGGCPPPPEAYTLVSRTACSRTRKQSATQENSRLHRAFAMCVCLWILWRCGDAAMRRETPKRHRKSDARGAHIHTGPMAPWPLGPHKPRKPKPHGGPTSPMGPTGSTGRTGQTGPTGQGR